MKLFDHPVIKNIIFVIHLIVPVVLVVLVVILITRVDYKTFIDHLKTYPLMNLVLAIVLVIIANMFLPFAGITY